MSLKEMTQEQIDDLSMIELGSIILKEENKAISFQDLFSKIADLKNFSEEKKENLIAQFYTDMNVDGRYLTLGSGMWGLKSWYPVEQAEEEITDEPKKRKKKKKAAVVEETEDINEDLDVTDEEIDDMLDDFEDVEDTDLEEIEDEVDDVIGKDDLDELDYDEEDDR
ncbi:DNA-directed RNA polymerase subunit delta [Oceanobacillus jeddahense]|uniref:Probable DNA-directed RNA polymerase subunit delta n=1 Tax=Oceanobacillus jeddahense TaxID=1462527 RepID=A0ABY5JQY3_9BACI|nr:DNA-directed RNA polymerase subunit delta [Oceanobacillus jeddahense]UUI02654.1 DNA-directed RNA polymerase subunit delta [Oceanobacillus jeddahense]